MKHIKNVKLGLTGEKLARRMLRKHFTNVRRQSWKFPFDYTGIDRLTGARVAIEVKTVRNENGKLVHIENGAMLRKLNFCQGTDRKGIMLVIVKNGDTKFYLAPLKQHLSKGCLVEL